MKTIKAIALSIIIIFVMGCDLFGNTNFSDPQDRKIENLKTFSKLYGYIRYFHPSDEAASINWNKFLYYGIEQATKAQNSVDLKNTLESLFLPIAPSIDIFFAGETPRKFDPAENIDDLVLISWQHRGVGADPNPEYKSIRLGRINRIFNWRFGIFQNSKMYDYGNKRFKLSAEVRTSENSKGEIEILGYAPNSGKYYYKAKTFENEKWEQLITASKNWMLQALVNEWQEFREAVINNRPPQVTGEYARHIMEVVLATFDSSNTGREVLINE